MEEADILSDRIAVIVDGKIKCIGTSLFLKNYYGDGYRLSLIISPNIDSKEIVKYIKKLIPIATLIDESGGSLVFGIKTENMKELGTFFKIMEKEGIEENEESLKTKQFKMHVKEWGLSHTTLEEVFMKVTNKKISKYT